MKTESKSRFFFRFGTKLWNAIPNEFRQLSKGAFKKIFTPFCSRQWKQRTIMLKCPFNGQFNSFF